MSERAAKATRRDLRRVVGDTTAAAFVEQSLLVARHEAFLAEQANRVDAHRGHLRNHEAQLNDLTARVHGLIQRLDAQRDWTVWHRLCWLLGRR